MWVAVCKLHHVQRTSFELVQKAVAHLKLVLYMFPCSIHLLRETSAQLSDSAAPTT